MVRARMARLLMTLVLLLVLSALVDDAVAEGRGPAVPFPLASPGAALDADAADRLDAHLRSLVENEQIVGGELLVIQNRRTVFQRAYGWHDRDKEQPLDTDAVYCVRSMTKPLIGTVVQLLIDEGRLSLDTPVHEILPSFAGNQARSITVGHLLTHTAGFPFSTLTRPLADYDDLAAVAAEAAAGDLDFAPGLRFQYSDASSETLGAIVAATTGESAETLVRRRILKPLGMADSFTRLGDDPTRRDRVPSAYSGGTGAWQKHWGPADPALLPLFLPSQGLYTTTSDYARFLAFWMDGAMHDGMNDRRFGARLLLSTEAVERALTPRHSLGRVSGFGGLDVHYGQHWMIYAEASDEGSTRRVAFGHDGSDGTHAWAWPDRDLIVLFFTQSRGTLAGLGLEQVVQDTLIDPVAAVDEAPVATTADVPGIYWDEDVAEAYYTITANGEQLILERPGRLRMVFVPGEPAGRWAYEANPAAWIEFVRAEDGTVTAMKTFFGRRIEHDPRHVPSADLPAVAEVVAAVEQAHGLDRLSTLGVVRMTGTLTVEARGMAATRTTYFDADRWRTEVLSDGFREITVVDGDRAWASTPMTGSRALEGIRLEQARHDRHPVLFGDWRGHYDQVEVLKRVELDGRSVWMVRVVPPTAPGATVFVDEATGVVVRSEGLALLPGVGFIGVRTDFSDVRDVGGMRLPFRSVATFRSPMIGRIETTWDQVEVGVEVADELFAAPVAGSGG
ncbi:MAG: serine hydrolase domain-containing protein [Acidobacteriota bacterium]